MKRVDYDALINRDNPLEREEEEAAEEAAEEDDGSDEYEAAQARDEDSPWNDPTYRRFAERDDR